MEGMPASTSISGLKNLPQPLRRQLSQVDRSHHSHRHGDDHRADGHQERPNQQRHQPEDVLDGIPAVAEKLPQGDVEKGVQPFLEQKEEDQPDENDRRDRRKHDNCFDDRTRGRVDCWSSLAALARSLHLGLA